MIGSERMNSKIYAVIPDGVGLLVAVLGDMASSGQEMRYDKVHMVMVCGNLEFFRIEGRSLRSHVVDGYRCLS